MSTDWLIERANPVGGGRRVHGGSPVEGETLAGPIAASRVTGPCLWNGARFAKAVCGPRLALGR